MKGQCGAVADHNQVAAGADEGDVGSPRVGEEANLTLLIRSHWRDDDRFLFPGPGSVDVFCGHIHEAYGEYRIGKTISANVSYVDVNYRPVNRVMTWEI